MRIQNYLNEMLENTEEYQKIFSLEENHWWYRSLHELTLNSIQKDFSEKNISILDAGCGTGGLLQKLHIAGFTNIKGTDVSEIAIDFAKKKVTSPLFQSDLQNYFSQHTEKNDVIIFNDVLYFFSPEEIKTILGQAEKTLNKNGIIIINIPSGNIFSGGHDKAVGIKKRFSRGEFLKLIPGNLKIKENKYWPFILSPAIAAKRALQRILNKNSNESDLKQESMNSILFSITSLEKKYLPHAPFGSSLFLVLKKENQSQ